MKRGKSDASMRVGKTDEQQAILMSHRPVASRTPALDGGECARAHLAEFGLVANPGIVSLAKLSEEGPRRTG